ncbi:MAG TPA: GspH/FimT family pseudopilin, partial [Erythrobacter sp.]|nr:GspH/FimT family pseudopilin [Erythrobacter sp.]
AMNGFTLIEMLVTLAVAGLIAGIAYPRMQNGMTAMEFRMGAGQVAEGLRTARSEAIRTGEPVALALEGRSLVIGDGDPVALPASVTVTAGQDVPVTFYPDGTAQPALYRIVSRGNGAVRERRITVFGSTGHIAESGQ